ncbi:putative DNA polymerase [Golovinomyces cichoracearum]|uniref:Probable DNA polymerase n=1 Tax=Golovinomyces cichoracearum TaxID=62708 RepID=A0A420IPU8_9PEZI|nr:putative DNA polymerase [Golovinomyces cichoracearum]
MTIKDELLNRSDLTTFKRTIFENKKTLVYCIEKGEVVFFTEKIRCGFIKPIGKVALNLDHRKIMTLDLETRALQKNHENLINKNTLSLIPTVMSIYDEEMMDGFRTIMKRKYDGYKIYTHNFSYFDSIFIIDVLSRLGEVKPIMRDNKILKLTFKFSLPNSKRKHTLYFMDSLLMLPNSLDKLSKSFNINNKKSIFPHLFLENPNISLNYRGVCPDYCYFPKAFTDDFKHIEYLKYACQFDNKDYFGGLTDVYKPIGTNIRSYDINSLYPHSMKSYPMPTGTPRYVKGSLENIKKYIGGSDKIPFGFYYVNVKAPDNLDKPFLPTRIGTGNGVRTVSPIGSWSG